MIDAPERSFADVQASRTTQRHRASVIRRVRRALGVGWFYPRGKTPLLQTLARRVLERFATRYGLFLTLGPLRPYRPITQRVFARDTPLTMHLDYVRYATAELICREIKEQRLPGSIGEVGVYMGLWARVVNHHLPNKTIWLFDTFAGFDRRDLGAQQRVGLSSEPPYEVGAIDPDDCVRFLTHPQRAIVRKGWFPATAQGLEEERFCYVDIDTGLYQATIAALRWFYPRLVPGGFLNVVDYNNAHAEGVRLATREFADEINLGYVPVPDHGASVVFVKPGH